MGNTCYVEDAVR